MPELPEVETVRDGLARHVVGARIEGVGVLRDYSVRRHVGGPEDFRAQLTGLTLSAAVRRGKYLWFLLDGADGEPTDLALLAHLGMSGQLLIPPAPTSPGPGALGPGAPAAGAPAHRHLRVRLTLGGTAATHLDFVDQRTFGYLAVVETVPTPDGGPGGQGSARPVVPEGVAHVGRDLFDPVLDLDGLVRSVRARRSGAKRALLDQRLVSGIGNIYADEALWRARVHFDRPCDRLPARTVRELLGAARDVMRDALRVGGTSFDSLYVNVNGESGYFARDLDAYGRAGQPCRRCGTTIVRAEFMNRSSFFCPTCQRRARRTGAR